jgi:hypothetical protein
MRSSCGLPVCSDAGVYVDVGLFGEVTGKLSGGRLTLSTEIKNCGAALEIFARDSQNRGMGKQCGEWPQALNQAQVCFWVQVDLQSK